MEHNRADLLSNTLHICVDMQAIFDTGQAWEASWFRKVLPNVLRLTEASKGETLFTRFVPPVRQDDASGCWRDYWTKWQHLTLEHGNPDLIELVQDLRSQSGHDLVFDKAGYSPWRNPSFTTAVAKRRPSTLILSGGETDVCVFAATLGAIDRGYFVVLAEDALWSTFDQTHEAALRIFRDRFSLQIEVMSTDDILTHWPS